LKAGKGMMLTMFQQMEESEGNKRKSLAKLERKSIVCFNIRKRGRKRSSLNVTLYVSTRGRRQRNNA
jgi:hypothetical protein